MSFPPLLLPLLPPLPRKVLLDCDTDMGHMSRVYDAVTPGLWEQEETRSGAVRLTHRGSDPSIHPD